MDQHSEKIESRFPWALAIFAMGTGAFVMLIFSHRSGDLLIVIAGIAARLWLLE